MKPVPRDDNGHALLDRGSELFTYRFTDLGTDMTEIGFPSDVKEVLFHVESGAEVLHVLGTVGGSTIARITDSGLSWTLPIAVARNAIFASIAAPSGTCNVSILAWR